MRFALYGIPSCGTCRKARKLLDSYDVDYDWVDLRESPPDAERLASWVHVLGVKAMRSLPGSRPTASRKVPSGGAG